MTAYFDKVVVFCFLFSMTTGIIMAIGDPSMYTMRGIAEKSSKTTQGLVIIPCTVLIFIFTVALLRMLKEFFEGGSDNDGTKILITYVIIWVIYCGLILTNEILILTPKNSEYLFTPINYLVATFINFFYTIVVAGLISISALICPCCFDWIISIKFIRDRLQRINYDNLSYRI